QDFIKPIINLNYEINFFFVDDITQVKSKSRQATLILTYFNKSKPSLKNISNLQLMDYGNRSVIFLLSYLSRGMYCYFCSMKHLLKFTFILLFISQTALAQELLKGKVVRISDGDTMTVLDSLNQQHRIRLHGIDSPEKGQDYYQVAKDYVGQLCFQKQVEVDILNYDHYKRDIWKFYVDGLVVIRGPLKVGVELQFNKFDPSEEYALSDF